MAELRWTGRAIALIDLDAFFASVEQLDHPEWAGSPVIVGGDAASRGVVSTASYEARAYGVHSAMPSAQAKRLCPQAIWAKPRMERYREMSDHVIALIEAETPYVERVSIDEAFFDISPGRFSHDDPQDICRCISEAVADLGITCSLGLSTSKTVSKIASERNKPNGMTVVYPGDEAAFLAPLPVKAMSGIGPKTADVLEHMGITTLGELAVASADDLRARLGVLGPRLKERAAGRDSEAVSPLDAPDDTKSVSSERTFAHDLTTQQEVDSALHYLASLTARRLRAKGLKGRTITLKCSYAYGEDRTARETLAYVTDDEHILAACALHLLEGLWSEGTHIRLLGIGCSNWEDTSQQLKLFDDDMTGEDDRDERLEHERLSSATDEVRRRFGSSAVMYGSEWIQRDNVSNTPSEHIDEHDQ